MESPDSTNRLTGNFPLGRPFVDGADIGVVESGDDVGFDEGAFAFVHLVLLVLDLHGVWFSCCVQTGATSIAPFNNYSVNHLAGFPGNVEIKKSVMRIIMECMNCNQLILKPLSALNRGENWRMNQKTDLTELTMIERMPTNSANNGTSKPSHMKWKRASVHASHHAASIAPSRSGCNQQM
jgi:hypothetical protein